jgi:hypothetical protein
MMKKLLHSALALVLTSGLAFAAFNLGFDGKIMPQGSGTAPALTSCGGGSPAITGTDVAGAVTMGTSATGCVITFNVAYALAPHCVVTWIATPLASQSYATSATAITLTQTSTSTNQVRYACFAQPGG